MKRTRIKMCGLTRPQDVLAAVAAGADAIGFVFYPPSPRAVSIAQARELCALLPPFVTSVGLFVNESAEQVREVLAAVPLGLLQFHGEEDAAYCASFGRPWMKAARVRAGFDLVNYAARFPGTAGLLVDAWVEGYGGGGEVFDWSLLPEHFPVPLVLAGGLTPENVAGAVRTVKPWAVDVSSGVEAAKGIKDRTLMEAFVAGVREADG
ncbi:phosphoribosylanthranilate isomerase [Uliginosibacterium sp. 31-16]|uniref:phosphoribosylanthranilate isomerase n=1 Tax=Uliginosibacterium sp. 31-16 TaxID=3068315 RepID=UPI00273D4E2D|nr:phosphoribosylanthranilate isomerase [Uliginosibacterium sp. 31-16]MDP5239796.1 phosphoribosylanthranilate isomerase [Uliginosibacterium sp. 31-16]